MSFAQRSVYDRDLEGEPGLRVLIMRRWPRGVRKERIDVWLKDAAPSVELLDALHAGSSWDEFETRYRAEIEHQRPTVLAQLRQLEREHGRVVLMCTERMPPHEHCHRLTLMTLLGESG